MIFLNREWNLFPNTNKLFTITSDKLNQSSVLKKIMRQGLTPEIIKHSLIVFFAVDV